MKRDSELAFKDICESNFKCFIKVVWNGKTIYKDADEGLYIENKLIKTDFETAIKKFKIKYESKKVYNFYCRVIAFHHTELYIEGEN